MGMDKSEMNRLSQSVLAKLAHQYHNDLSSSIRKSVDATAWFLVQTYPYHSLTFTTARTSEFTLQQQICTDINKSKGKIE